MGLLNWINDIADSYREQQRLNAEAKRRMQEKARKEREKELIELRLITINNVRYLRSYISTLRSMSNTIKGASAAETRKKRDWAKSQVKWLETKLKEEQYMEVYWNQKIQEEGILIA